jgi:adenylyltransferase/sulfurtransferase
MSAPAMPPTDAPTDALSSSELARYSRHILLPGVGVEGQRKLAAARVLVVGAGGLGSPAALYLAAAGVGTIGIADFDRVELHNLQRQILHDTAAIGRPKVESAAARLRALNPHIRLATHAEGVTAANALAFFRGYDVIVDGTDNFPTRYLNNDAAVLAGRPLVYGSIFQFEGQVSVFDPAHGAPCYRCLFPSPPPPGSVPNCGEAGVLGALCGTIGSLQALEAIKLILGVGEPLRGRLVVFDALAHSFRTLNLRRDPACPLCGPSPRIRELRAEEYSFGCAPPSASPAPAPSASNDGPGEEAIPAEIDVASARTQLACGAATLLDVREPHEHAICQIPGSMLLPMRQVPAALAQLPRDRNLLVLCHHGARSLRVTQFLRANGFARAINIGGGIDAWAAELDESLQRY